jgi:phosphoribosylformimino-5-aminoimidazole carboxamide ribotide isomerase
VTDAKVQVGGGIRSLDTANFYLGLGVKRLILGTTAVESPEVISSIIEVNGSESVVVSIDARDGFVALDGWTRGTQVTISSLISSMSGYGVVRCMYTDITRDGTLTEPNYQSIGKVADSTDMRIIAAGGISTVESIMRLHELGIEAAIVGKAIYTGRLSLVDAINAVK